MGVKKLEIALTQDVIEVKVKYIFCGGFQVLWSASVKSWEVFDKLLVESKSAKWNILLQVTLIFTWGEFSREKE